MSNNNCPIDYLNFLSIALKYQPICQNNKSVIPHCQLQYNCNNLMRYFCIEVHTLQSLLGRRHSCGQPLMFSDTTSAKKIRIIITLFSFVLGEDKIWRIRISNTSYSVEYTSYCAEYTSHSTIVYKLRCIVHKLPCRIYKPQHNSIVYKLRCIVYKLLCRIIIQATV